MNIESANEILAAVRLKLDELELVLNEASAAEARSGLPTFDPDHDEPPVTPDVEGSRLQRDWCSLILWASLRALNIRQGRAATPVESVAIAKKAGYQDGRGWNAWTHGYEKDSDGGRLMTDDGMVHLRNAYTAVGRAIPEDLA